MFAFTSEYDFAILSLPRSGSHMLASALDSHPEIQCQGEYGMTEKFPLGRRPGRIKGCIVQGYHISRHIAPPWIRNSRIIVLTRSLLAIAKSLHYNTMNGSTYDQHLEPVQRGPQRSTPSPDTIRRLEAEQEAIAHFLEFANPNALLHVEYRLLCGDKDARAIRWEQAHRICDFLGVERLPMRPLTHKPSAL